jgi:hypothetical protein
MNHILKWDNSYSCYKKVLFWSMNGICETKMLRRYNSTFYIVIKAIPNPRFDGCIGECLLTKLVITRTWEEVCYSFDNHQGSSLPT